MPSLRSGTFDRTPSRQMTGERFCPLCDQNMSETVCPTHRVPTIRTGGPPSSQKRLEVGTVLVGRYRIEGLLNHGGMGALLNATQLSTGQNVVVKVLKGQRIQDLANVRRFYQEARIAQTLHHENIVAIIEFGVDEATRAPFIAMEHIEGMTLKDLVTKEGPQTEARTTALFAQVAQALVEAHAHQVLHRDLKPSNIMVGPGPNGPDLVKVLDFGLAKLIQPDDTIKRLTLPGKTVGTPAFMSPEQVTQRPQDFRADLYGLGCVLHATLTGRPPFVSNDLVNVMRMQMKVLAPPLPAFLSDGQPPSPGLVTLHTRLLAKDPADRPASTLEVAEVFQRLSAPQKNTVTSPNVSTPTIAWNVDSLVIPTEDGEEPVASFADDEATLPSTQDHSLGGSASDTLPPTNNESWTRTVVEDAPIQLDDFEPSEGNLTSILPSGLDQEEVPVQDGDPILGASLLRPNPNRLTKTATERPPQLESTAPTAPVKLHVQPPRQRSRMLLFFVIGLAVLMATAAVLSLLLRKPEEITVVPPPPPITPTPTPAAAPSVTPRIEPVARRITIRSQPSGAKVWKNGRVVGRTPLTLERPSNSSPVRLRFVLPKHVTKEVVIDANTTSLNVELSRTK